MTSESGRRGLGRDLFSIQLEVTEKLLEAEEKKLKVLKAEIEASKHSDTAASSTKAKELELQENNYLRIKMQHHRLSQEMQEVAMASLIQRRPRIKASRSLPAIAIKQPLRPRPSVFDYLVPRPIDDASSGQGVSGPAQLSLNLLHGVQSSSAALYTHGQHSDELEYKDGIVIAGSLNALIDLLVPTETHYPERAYVFAFILCARLFLRPYELLARVSRIFHMQQKHFVATGKPAMEGPAPKVVQLLSEWTETFPYDFRDERMMRSLKEMTQTCAGISTDLRRQVGQLQSTLVKKLSILDKYEHVLAQVNAVAMERLIDPKTQVNIFGVCEDPVTLAQQLTHIELERLNNIGPEEFIQTFVKSTNDSEPLYRDMKKTSNLEAYVEWFNRLSYLVATEICVVDKKRNRVKLLEFFLDTARECRKLNNFNSYVAISAGLFMSPVARLKKTRSKVSAAKIHEIETFVEPFNNFSHYRRALRLAIDQANQEPRQSCAVPFFSLLVKDIYFLHEGMSTRLPNGYIRIDKCMSLAGQVSQILAYKDIVVSVEAYKDTVVSVEREECMSLAGQVSQILAYKDTVVSVEREECMSLAGQVSQILAYKDTVLPFPRVRSVLNYLMTIPIHVDDELQLASFEIEPPENSGEKKRYQELRVTLGSFGQRIRRTSSGGSGTTSPLSAPTSPTSPTFPTIQEEL